MRLFHYFTVTHVHVEDHQLPKIATGDFLVFGDSIEAAFLQISAYDAVVNCSEVWGAEREIDPSHPVLTTPTSVNVRQNSYSSHTHWTSVQERYTQVYVGEHSIASLIEASYEAYRARLNPVRVCYG